MLNIIIAGDSKALGIGELSDALGMPNIVSPGNYGVGYTADPTQTTLTGGTGSGAQYVSKLMTSGAYPNTGNLAVFMTSHGSGYTSDSSLPTVAIVGGGAPTTAATYLSTRAGGWASRLEASLISAGYAVQVLNHGRSGSGITDLPPGTNFVSEASFFALQSFGQANSFYLFSTGINDSNSGLALADWSTAATNLITRMVANGVKVCCNLTCKIEAPTPGLTSAQITASNSLLQSYNNFLRNYASANPTKLTIITDEDAICTGHPEYFGGNGVHPTAPGNTAIANDMLPRVKSFISSNFASSAPDPFKSDTATSSNTLVDYKPNMPSPFVVSGLGTFNLPTAVLTVGTPTDLPGGRFVWLRRPAGSGGVYAILGNTTGVDANTPPVHTFTDTTCLNGVHYDYGVYALPSGDF